MTRFSYAYLESLLLDAVEREQKLFDDFPEKVFCHSCASLCTGVRARADLCTLDLTHVYSYSCVKCCSSQWFLIGSASAKRDFFSRFGVLQ